MIDPVTLAVIQAGLQQVCDEMDLTFSRAAFSPVIAEANDRSDGIYAAEDGALIAQGEGGRRRSHYRVWHGLAQLVPVAVHPGIFMFLHETVDGLVAEG